MKRRRKLYDRLSPVYCFGGAPANTTSVTENKLSPELAREIGPFAEFAKSVVHRPYTPYKAKDLVAGLNTDQAAAFNLGRQGSGAVGQYDAMMAQGPFQGPRSSQELSAGDYLSRVYGGQDITGAENFGRDYLGNVLGGNLVSPDERFAGQYLGNVIGGREISPEERAASQYGGNVMAGREVSPEERSASQFLGGFYGNQQNPYFEQQLGIGRKRIGEQYAESIAPGLAGKYAMAGAFGGTAASEAEGRSQRELVRGLGEYESGARSAEQERRYAQGLQAAGLTEATAGRRIGQGLQAAGLAEQTAGRRIGQGLEASGLTEQTAGRRIGQGLQATGQIEQTAGRRQQSGLQAAGLTENTAARLAQNALADAGLRAGLIGQRADAYQNDFTRLLGVGAQEQEQQQKLLDAKYAQFLRKDQYPAQTFNIYRDAIAALTGAGGGSSSQSQSSSGGGPGAGQLAAGGVTTAASLYALYSAYQGAQAAQAAATAAGAACWVAREVFGTQDDRWKQFRLWLFVLAPKWFRKAYLRHGPEWAAFLRRHPWLKRAVRWWMERRIKGSA